MSIIDTIYKKIEDFLPYLISENDKYLKNIPDFVEDFSPKIDSIIEDIEKCKDVEYSVGKLTLSLINNDEMQMTTDLYFRYKNYDEFFNQKIKSSIMDMSLFLTSDSVNELRAIKEISFPIEKR